MLCSNAVGKLEFGHTRKILTKNGFLAAFSSSRSLVVCWLVGFSVGWPYGSVKSDLCFSKANENSFNCTLSSYSQTNKLLMLLIVFSLSHLNFQLEIRSWVVADDVLLVRTFSVYCPCIVQCAYVAAWWQRQYTFVFVVACSTRLTVVSINSKCASSMV